MNKQSILGFVLIGLIFIGFITYTSMQQKEYSRELQEQQAVAAATAVPSETADSVEVATQTADATAAPIANVVAADSTAQTQLYGKYLAAALQRVEEKVEVENDVLKLEFSSKGGRIVSAVLKDYTKYAPTKEQRTELVQLMDPQTAAFALQFYIKNGMNNVAVNSADYNFEMLPVEGNEQSQRVKMRLAVGENSYLTYIYTVYNELRPERDYLVDFEIQLDNMAPVMSNQSSIGVEWANSSYQNERGFKNENNYTTIAYRLPKERNISEVGMGEGERDEKISSSVNWVAFKQQYFSSVLISRDSNFNYADLAFSTAKPNSGYVKNFSAKMSLPYNEQTVGYNLSYYLGPNKFAVLKKIKDANDESIALERIIPLGWIISSWISRWVVIPVFDFLQTYIASFGLIILILAIGVKIVIFPLVYKSYLSTAKMRVVKPEIDALAEKYPRKEDAMKKQQATMELYKKAGINPMGGCIPMLIQMPVIIAMFRFFPASIELRGQSFLWASDLASYDSIWQLPFSIPFYGDHVSLFALMMAVSMFGFSYFNYQQTASAQPQMAGMKFMMVYMMPVMMLFWFNDFSSGLCYYYFLANILTILQTLVIRRFVDDDTIHAKLQANMAKRSGGKKSRFQAKYEELMQQQQQASKRK